MIMVGIRWDGSNRGLMDGSAMWRINDSTNRLASLTGRVARLRSENRAMGNLVDRQRHPLGALDPPVKGRFGNGVGTSIPMGRCRKANPHAVHLVEDYANMAHGYRFIRLMRERHGKRIGSWSSSGLSRREHDAAKLP